MTRDQIIQAYTENLRNPKSPGDSLSGALDSLTSMIATPALKQVQQGDFSYKDALNGLFAKEKDKKDWVAVVKERYPQLSPMKQKLYGTLLNILLDPTNLVPGAMMAGEIKNVYHGSPHLFDAFDLSKVGTGEGHQTFGHGIYLTDSKKYATENYAERLSKNRYPGIDTLQEFYTPGRIIDSYGGKDKVVKFNRYTNPQSGMENWDVSVRAVERDGSLGPLRSHSTLPEQRELKKVLGEDYKTAHVYEATIKEGQKHNLLNWYDKVDKQNLDKITQTYIKEHRPEWQTGTSEKLFGKDPDGYTVYNFLTAALGGKAEASAFLRKAGIDGIEYPTGSLSGISNSPNKNYVIFDDKDIKINKRESR